MDEPLRVLRRWLRRKLKKVVVACPDPNPLVAGKGVQILKNAGIEVEIGICEDLAAQLNQGF